MATNIHPTALVSPEAKLGVDIEIGPYSIIGPSVQIGDKSHISSHVRITGNTQIGESNHFFHACIIGEEAQSLQFHDKDGQIIIGNNNVFRECFTIHRPSKNDGLTKVGNDCYFMAYTHIAHDCVVGNGVIIANSTALGGFVTVEEYVFISASVAIHQHCRLGKCSMIGGVSKVVQDVPPFIMTTGNPAKADTLNILGMRRIGITPAARMALKKAFKLVYLNQKSFTNGVNGIKAQLLTEMEGEEESYRLVKDFTEFISSANKRGVIGYSKKN